MHVMPRVRTHLNIHERTRLQTCRMCKLKSLYIDTASCGHRSAFRVIARNTPFCRSALSVSRCWFLLTSSRRDQESSLHFWSASGRLAHLRCSVGFFSGLSWGRRADARCNDVQIVLPPCESGRVFWQMSAMTF